MAIKDQPVNAVQWIDPATLTANNYNPNHVPPIEFKTLKVSILEDGWTQPIVIREDREIVDGFHRWKLALEDKDIQALTENGQVPVVIVKSVDGDLPHQIMSTIRHNRARGEHTIIKMADIVIFLLEQGIPTEEICKRLGMEPEEVERLNDRGNMRERGSRDGFNQGWVPDFSHKR